MRIHRYARQENGLMIIFSADELKTLGQQLSEPTASNANTHSPLWPPMLATFKPEGGGDFTVSFHMEITPPKPQTNFPNPQYTLSQKILRAGQPGLPAAWFFPLTSAEVISGLFDKRHSPAMLAS
jgi:hypothetical protein